MTVHAIQIGLDPEVIDYDSPDFARFPDLTEETLRAANDDNIELLRRAGYDVDGCPVDFGDTAVEVVRERITRKRYDAVLIGAGIRLVARNTRLFEALVNLVHVELPDARFVFNQAAETSPDDIRRWFPDATHAANSALPTNQADFQRRPTHCVTGILPSGRLQPCWQALAAAGLDLDTILVLSGPEGADILDADGSRHGVGAMIYRSLQKMGTAQNELENYSRALVHGHAVVAVPVADHDQALDVATVLEHTGGERVQYFGPHAVEKM